MTSQMTSPEPVSAEAVDIDIIVAHLRAEANDADRRTYCGLLLRNAALLIERQQARIAELERALQEIMDRHPSAVTMGGPKPCKCPTCAIARAALEPPKA